MQHKYVAGDMCELKIGWRSFMIATGSVSLIILSILWMKKRLARKSQLEENKDKKTESLIKVSKIEKMVEMISVTIPELPEPKWVKVGSVKELYIYPLKSGKGKKLEYCDFTEFGVSVEADGYFNLKDRMFLVYNEETGKFQTGRQYPTLILVSLSPANETCVKLEAVGMPSLVFEVPINLKETSKIAECSMWFGEKVKCIDCGPETSKWISSFLTGIDSGLRLGYVFLQKYRNIQTSQWKKYMNIYASMRNEDMGLLSDLASYMLMTKSSLNDLNKRLEKSVSVLQFRPNIFISGSEAFAEDNWEWIRIGKSVVIRNFKPCTRCKMTCVDPQSGIADPHEPLKTLRLFRELTDPTKRALEGNSPVLGIYCGLYISGHVKVGDEVYIHKSD